MGSCITFVQMGFQLEFLSWIQQIGRDINIKVVFHAGCHKPKDNCFKVYSSNPSPGAVRSMCEREREQAQVDQKSFPTIVLLKQYLIADQLQLLKQLLMDFSLPWKIFLDPCKFSESTTSTGGLHTVYYLLVAQLHLPPFLGSKCPPIPSFLIFVILIILFCFFLGHLF